LKFEYPNPLQPVQTINRAPVPVRKRIAVWLRFTRSRKSPATVRSARVPPPSTPARTINRPPVPVRRMAVWLRFQRRSARVRSSAQSRVELALFRRTPIAHSSAFVAIGFVFTPRAKHPELHISAQSSTRQPSIGHRRIAM